MIIAKIKWFKVKVFTLECYNKNMVCIKPKSTTIYNLNNGLKSMELMHTINECKKFENSDWPNIEIENTFNEVVASL